MKIRNLSLKNFARHRELELRFTKPAVYILGANYSGKTSIREAIRWLLTGRSQVTDRAGRGASRLSTLGAVGETSVGATLEGQRAIDVRRTLPSKLTVWPSAADQLTGLPAEDLLLQLGAGESVLLEAVVDPTFLLSGELSPAERTKALSAIIETKVSLVALQQAFLPDAGVGAAAIERFTSQATISRPEGRPLTLGDLADLHNHFYEKRKLAKAARDQAGASLNGLPPVVVPSEEEIGQARSFLEEARTQLSVANEEKGRLSQQIAVRNRLLLRIDELKAILPPEEAPVQQGLAGIADDDDLARRVKELEEKATLRDSDRRRNSEKLLMANGERRDLEEEIRLVESGDATCPSVCAPAACPILEKEAASRKKDLPGLKTKLSGARESIASLEADEQKIAAALKVILDELEELKRKAAKSAGADEQRREELLRLLAEVKELDPDEKLGLYVENNSALVGELQDKIYRTEQMLRAAGQAGKHEERKRLLNEQLADAAAAADQSDELVKALDPKAIPAKIIATAIGPLREWIERFADVLWPGAGVSIDSDPKEGIAILAAPPGVTGFLQPAQLSKSEQLRLGIVLSAAIAHFTGARFLVIDEGDILDDLGKGALDELIERIVDRQILDQVIVLATSSTPKAFVTPFSEGIALTGATPAPVAEPVGA